MKRLILLLASAVAVSAQTPLDKPSVVVRILYVDRPPTPAEVASAESSGKVLEPSIYFLAPQEPGKTAEFSGLLLPFSRPSQPLTLPEGTKLSLFSKPEMSSRFAQVDPGKQTEVLAILTASRDAGFSDAKVRVLDTSGPGFPPGHLRVINLTDRTISVRTLDAPKQVAVDETVTFKPTAGRRDTVPVVISADDRGSWRELHSGAVKLRMNTRVTILVTGRHTWGKAMPYTVEYLSEVSEPGR